VLTMCIFTRGPDPFSAQVTRCTADGYMSMYSFMTDTATFFITKVHFFFKRVFTAIYSTVQRLISQIISSEELVDGTS
jgi:hypothetical protein